MRRALGFARRPRLSPLRRATEILRDARGERLSLSGRVRLVAAHWRLRRNAPGRALAAARRLAESTPDAPGPHALAGLALLRLGRPDEALAATRAAAKCEPVAERIAHIAGTVALRAGDPHLATDIFARAAETDGSVLLWRRAARASLRAGAPDRTLGIVSGGLARFPDDVGLLTARAIALTTLGSPIEAGGSLDLATERCRGSARATWRVASTFLSLERPDDALRVIRDCAPRDRVPFLLARAWVRLRDDRALPAAAEAVRLEPRRAGAHWLHAIALRRAGHDQAALVAVRRARRLRDERRFEDYERLVRAALARKEARALRRSGRFADAARATDEAFALAPDNPWNFHLLAAIRKDLGDLTGAVAAIERARDLDGDQRIVEAERRLRGLIRTLSDDWLPEIPGGARSIDPVEGRILHLLDRSLPHRTSGYTIRSHYTLKAQRAAGLDPIVVTRLGVPVIDEAPSFELLEHVDGIPHHRLLLDGVERYDLLPNDEYLEAYARGAAAVVEARRPAILHPAASYLNGIVGLALKRTFGLPLVYEMRGFLEETWASKRDDARRNEFREARARVDSRCMLGADRVVTLAEVMRTEIEARGVDPDRIVVVPNAVDAEQFSPQEKRADLVRDLELGGRVTIGYVSSLVGYEGINVLVRATADLIRKGLPVTCLLVGDGPEMESLQALASSLRISDRVRFTGRVPHDEITDYYALLDVFVVPRRNFRVSQLVTPLKPFEAMAMGIPLLVSNVAALREVVAPPERGVTFIADDHRSLAQEAERLVRDPGLRARLGAAGRDWVRRERTWERNAERYREMYEQLADEARRLRAGELTRG